MKSAPTTVSRSFAAMAVPWAAAVLRVMNPAALAAGDPADLRPALEPVRDQFHAPALAGAIVRDGTLIGVGVCGVRTAGAADPATASDRFPIGSCSKNAARLVIARLNERGELMIDATVGESFAGVPVRPEYKPVTIADLLAHRAGIKPYEQIGPRITPEVFDRTGTPTEQRARFAAHVLGLEPAAPPRTRFVYSNAGFCVVAAMAEKSTGKPWDVLVSNEVFTPLGLTSAVVGVDPLGSIRGHEPGPNGYEPVRQVRPRLAVMEPAGGLCMSIADFAKFAAAEAELAAGRPAAGLTDKTLKRLPALRPADMPGRAQPGEAYFGGDGQFTAAFAVWPEQHVGIAVATNAGEGDDICTAAIEAIRRTLAADLPHGPDASGPDRTAAPAGKEPAATPDGPRYGFSIRADESGMAVGDVAPGSIAEKAGLRKDDVIVSLNGTKVTDIEPDKLREFVGAKALQLVVERDGKQVRVEMKK